MDSLVSIQWLAGQLGSTDLAILDASSHLPMAGRDARAEFLQGHVPGARFLDLATLFDPSSPVPTALPTREQLAGRLSDLAIPHDARIVLYDDSDVRTAARAWFIFRMHGLREVAILDGGLGKWRAEGRPVESGSNAPGGSADAHLSPAGSGIGEVRTKEQMLANVATGAEQVLDARETGRFTGELPDFRPEVAAGHIPGSRSLPYDQVLNADGTYKSPVELRRVFANAGVDLDVPVVTTCGGGITAAVLLFAMHLIGKEDVALYDGSWSEWGADPATPKELGPASIG